MVAASAANIEEFLSGPLVTWLSTCIKKPESLQVYETFFDGSPINEVLLQIDPEPSHPVPVLINLQGLSVTASRIKIFHSIIKNIKTIYEAELGQVVVALPDCVTIGRSPSSQEALQHLKLIILLLLGCAVQGPTKEIFIARIKELGLDVQHEIVECIKRVTDDQSVVLTLDWPNQTPEKLYLHLRDLTNERDALFQHWVTDLGQEMGQSNGDKHGLTPTGGNPEGFESNHLAVELADWKARLRKQRQELEEKTELLTECKEELDHSQCIISKLKAENCDLLTEARKAKAYRDEVDAMSEKALRVEKLEAQVQRYRERLADTDFYKMTVAELREDNRVLLESRETLEADLARARQKANRLLELEAELLASKQVINDITLERDADREKMTDLMDENFQLQQVTKSALQETTNFKLTTETDEEESGNSGDNSLSEQLTNNAQARALRLELENQKLLSTIDSLKENNFHENSKRILDLEKEKKKLELKQDQLVESCERVKQQNRELEELFRASIQENKKLQTVIDTNKVNSDKQTQDLQNERIKVEELEKNMDVLNKEKQRVHSLCETVKRRADDAEKCLEHANVSLEHFKSTASKSKEFEQMSTDLTAKITTMEKDHATVQKEVVRLKEILETKDRTLDTQSELCEKKEKDIIKLTRDLETLSGQSEKLSEFEKKYQELNSQTTVHLETITTLQKDLVGEKVVNEKCKSILEKMGLGLDILDTDVSTIVERMFEKSDLALTIVTYAKEKLSLEKPVKVERDPELDLKCEKLTNDLNTMQNENAKMQVDISTLTSQVNSLQTQQTALQLANSQLVAEKEELTKQNEAKRLTYDAMLVDLSTIRNLHEQLGKDYEDAKKEQETLKKTLRDSKAEARNTKEMNDGLEKKVTNLEQEKDALKNESKSLGNLRTEHSKLKDDFRHLFTANERLKTEYRALQEENKSLRAETSKLRLSKGEVETELNARIDILKSMQQRCDILYEMNTSLDGDRRALMDQVTKLLAQYHSLLLHSLEDKEHFHLEEKMFTDRLNNLCRQKEKLEEKIMEHYRKMDNASVKKRGFGANLIKKLRKTGSDMIKSPRNRRSWHEDAEKSSSQLMIVGAGSGESAGNDSDNSMGDPQVPRSEPFKRSVGSLHGHKPRDEVALRRSHRDLTSHRNSVAGDQVYPREPQGPLSLGSVGTRRTVYLSEDDPAPPSTPTNTSSNNPNDTPFMVYNKISVFGDSQRSQMVTSTPVHQQQSKNEEVHDVPTDRKPKGDGAKENETWFEYGCV
ncbi:PREDICTED: protein Daple [Nicrophorus vespilloides]|uniref:Protein Daple n=1 Tax=Nicrophorus vespilloides TaxID=110193 RepID=A0ABM1NHI9_NICVS|nr:PREDICTED: protein Daple [Nicrophorus vespilloides]